MEAFGTAEAKRRFSELVDRVGSGERFVVTRRNRPVLALVPPEQADLDDRQNREPTGLASIAGALAEWEDLDEVAAEIYEARRSSGDRPVPELDG